MTTLLVTLTVLVAVVALALASWVHVDGIVDGEQARVRVRWAALGVIASVPARAIEVTVFGLRVARRPLPGGHGRADADVDDDRSARRRSRRVPSLLRVRAAWRFYRRQLDFVLERVHVGHLVAHVRIASPDPSLTGITYGFGCAVAAPVLRRWPMARLSLEPDFTSEVPSGRGSVAARVRVATMAMVGWRVLRYERANGRGSTAAAPGKGRDHGSS